ncbi:gamma-glutamyltransferase [Agromyces aerolatus]|uniref:gamma-glutamyltransferase n=1 Tax=Agromyces sp. LY-1074 TaxID=3074080 RepID=UPI00286461DD|nr:MULTISPECIES: gamma-glutamyltransferase [unclassified Agromyces]MDR5698762.1 gamma-glutamyltransferase [Agromyces sp. LY-1074]MDR5705056.1 gamma-glutamyltransferase [Agromyces sp. LY-1358]
MKPEYATPGRFGAKSVVTGTRGMVVSSEPIAVEAGAAVLREGGNALDAALAVAATQLVTEPHMTSITGGISLVYREAATGTASYLSGNINAPLAELPDFGGADLTRARGVPVPGWWPAFAAAHERFGTMPVGRLLAPAIDAAREGFAVSPYLFGEMYHARQNLGRNPQSREMFFRDGSLIGPGEALVQERTARTLKRLRDEGMDYYLGDFARAFCAASDSDGGVITIADFEAYEPEWADPVRGTYRGFELIGSAPPDDGGLQLVEAFNMLEQLDLAALGPASASPETLSALIAVHNAVYYAAPRERRFREDARVMDVLLSKEYARQRFALLDTLAAPAGATPPSPGTIHLSVIDADHNVATLTHSHMASPWVNGLYAEGFQLAGGGSFFQRVMPQPGERATIYLAPSLVLRDGAPVIVSGSPSVSLVACVLQNLVNLMDFGMPIEQSVAEPRFGARPHDPARGWVPGTTLESGFPDAVLADVQRWAGRNRLWTREIGPWNSMTGNFDGITIDQATGEMRSCGDPRRMGIAVAA